MPNRQQSLARASATASEGDGSQSPVAMETGMKNTDPNCPWPGWLPAGDSCELPPSFLPQGPHLDILPSFLVLLQDTAGVQWSLRDLRRLLRRENGTE